MNEIGKLIPTLARAIEGRQEILSAYLFGSMASGHARTGSDVDIAVRLETGLSVDERFRIRLELMESLEKKIDRIVDVVVLNDAALILVNQVLSHGIPIFIRDKNDEEILKVLKQKEFYDFRYYIERDFGKMAEYFGGRGNDRK